MGKELITNNNPKSVVAESFKTIRTNLQFMSFNKGVKTILITSTLPGEGKSWTTANLAVAFAQSGERVLIIDADMRKGRQHKIFGIEPKRGLSDILIEVKNIRNLSEEVKEENVSDKYSVIKNHIVKTEIENIDLIPIGSIPENPTELLSSYKFNKVLDTLKEYYDIILLDGTPSLLVSDSVIVSRVVDITVIVTVYGKTKKDELERVKKDIKNVGGKIAGVIINKIPKTDKRYKSSYYYDSSDRTATHRM